jgi:hypothetical protein
MDAISRIDMIAKTGLMAPTANRQGQKLFFLVYQIVPVN